MSDRPKTTYEKARAAAGLDPIGDHTDQFMAESAEESNLDSETRLKMRYRYVLGRLEVSDDPKWDTRRKDLEGQLMDAGIRPSSLLQEEP